jgi:hypothetical protein
VCDFFERSENMSDEHFAIRAARWLGQITVGVWALGATLYSLLLSVAVGVAVGAGWVCSCGG